MNIKNFPGYTRRYLDNGRVIDMMPLTYNRWRLGVGPSNTYVYDDVY